MSEIPRHRMLALLAECIGDEIWSLQLCRSRRVPEDWITELADAYESGYRSDAQTIYTDQGATNQYHGVHDLDLALRLAKSMGIRVTENDLARLGRVRVVQAIKDAVMNGDGEL